MKVIDGHLVYTGGSLLSSINKDDIKTVEVAATVTKIATMALMACVNLLIVTFTSPSSVMTVKGGGVQGLYVHGHVHPPKPSSPSKRRHAWTALNL